MERVSAILLLETAETAQRTASSQDHHGRRQVRGQMGRWEMTSKQLLCDVAISEVLVFFLSPLSSISRGEAMELLRRWFVESKGTVNVSEALTISLVTG